jgi:integration host factor subunit alpha
VTLTKSHIINAIADQIGFPKNHSSEIVETILEIIKKALESGDDVMISNFGKFCVREKKERRGRNPATSEDMILEPRKVVTFRCSGKLREKINVLPG